MNGIVFIDKKEWVTSFDAIKKIKKHFNTSKVGHCGTLDPFASGLLIIGINQATKVLNFLENDYKEYQATLNFGEFKDSYDIEGNTIETKEIVRHTDEEVINALNSFLGKSTQIPPVYSAIQVNGKHLYDYARNNENVDIPKREVYICDIKLISNDGDSITFYVKCHKGTYIRSLGVDIAKKLGNIGYLSKLRRLSIGSVSVANASTYSDIENNNIKLYTIKDVINLPTCKIDDKNILKKIYNGQTIKLDVDYDKIMIEDQNDIVAIYYLKDGYYHCYRGLFDEEIRFKRIKELQG